MDNMRAFVSNAWGSLLFAIAGAMMLSDSPYGAALGYWHGVFVVLVALCVSYCAALGVSAYLIALREDRRAFAEARAASEMLAQSEARMALQLKSGGAHVPVENAARFKQTGSIDALDENTPGVVYFVADADLEYVKIGYTSKADAESRLRSLQTGNPKQLHILALLPGTAELEEAAHQAFRAHWVKGEWFRLEGGLREYIDTLRGEE